MEKEFGKLSRSQLRTFFAYHHNCKEQRREVNDLSISKQPSIQEILANGPTWSLWYELPYRTLLILLLDAFNMLEDIIEISKQRDPHQALIAYIETDEDEGKDDGDEFSIEEKGLLFSLAFANIGNIDALSLYGTHMNALVQGAKDDDEKLFNAVLVDRTAVACPTIAKRIGLASLQGDEGFMNRLAKAITRTRPRRPKEELDDLRYMLCILDEAKPLSSVPMKDLYDLLENDLELCSAKPGGDSHEALRKLVQRMRGSRT
ncbi:MAG: hypothetical protein RPU64_05890 [Candidatus Sedimenticola sp. (ex Thyasira tokunagai)]